MIEETTLTEGERAHIVKQLREYLFRVRQVFHHSYSSQVHRRWWPAFVLLDDMKDHLPFLIDWLGRDKVEGYADNMTPLPESLIDFEDRGERWRDKRRLFSSDQKRDLYFAAGGRCSICRAPLGNDWHADHIVAWSRGGETSVANGQALCPLCNGRKHAKDFTLDEP